MSPAGWFLFILLGIGIATGIGLLLNSDESPFYLEEETNSSEEDNESEDESDDEIPSDTSKDIKDADNDEKADNEESEDSPVDDTETNSEESEDFNNLDELLGIADDDFELIEYTQSPHDPEKQSTYNDHDDPDPSSEAMIAAIEWLINANTEAIHQSGPRTEFIGYLRDYIDAPRAHGAEKVSKTEWRNLSPNLSRLTGERLLVMSLGLSAFGNIEMDAHRKAYLAMMGNTWAEDQLEQPLLYQVIGRTGILTNTDLSSLHDELKTRIPGRVIRDSDAKLKDIAHFHSLIFSAAPGEDYPFPEGDKGLSRLWHWDEHNPPLAEVEELPAILYSLWIHYRTGGDQSEAANDFGALLGAWWNDKEPNSELFDENPLVWESILLTGWVLLGDQSIIWEQLENRFEEMSFENSELIEITETVLDWTKQLEEDETEPDNAPERNTLPPKEWITPLPSDLIKDHSEPSFDYSEEWCKQLGIMDQPQLSENS